MDTSRIARGLLAAAVAIGVGLAVAGPANAGGRGHDRDGRGVPTSQISVQLWTFAEYIGFGTDAATIARTEEVFRRLRAMGYRNVEPFTLSGLTAEQYRALLDKYGLQGVRRATSTSARRRRRSNIEPDHRREPDARDQVLRLRRARRASYATEAEWVAYAKYLNEIGEQARRAGQTLMVHNHNWEFEQVSTTGRCSTS